MDSVSNALSRKVASEFGTNHATVCMNASYISPDYSGFVRFSTRSHCVVLCFVHIRTPLACIEFSFISSINTFNFKKSCVFPQVPGTALTASKNSLGPQPSRRICRFRSLVPSRPARAPRRPREPFWCDLQDF